MPRAFFPANLQARLTDSRRSMSFQMNHHSLRNESKLIFMCTLPYTDIHVFGSDRSQLVTIKLLEPI
jgi:hypothetical protein